MRQSRKDKMLETVQEMVDLVKRTPEGTSCTKTCAPMRLRNMAEKI